MIDRTHAPPKLLSEDWNEHPHIPDRNTVDISPEMISCLTHKQNKSGQQAIWDQTYILSRILGRRELDLMSHSIGQPKGEHGNGIGKTLDEHD